MFCLQPWVCLLHSHGRHKQNYTSCVLTRTTNIVLSVFRSVRNVRVHISKWIFPLLLGNLILLSFFFFFSPSKLTFAEKPPNVHVVSGRRGGSRVKTWPGQREETLTTRGTPGREKSDGGGRRGPWPDRTDTFGTFFLPIVGCGQLWEDPLAHTYTYGRTLVMRTYFSSSSLHVWVMCESLCAYWRVCT